MKNCTICNKELLDDAVFCSFCGSKQEEIKKEEIQEPKETVAIKPKKKLPVFSIIRNSVILFVAVLLVICSFMPIATMPAEEYEISSVVEAFTGTSVNVDFEDLDLGINTIQSIILIFDSFKDLDEDEIFKSEVYEEILDLSEELDEIDAEEASDLSMKEKRDIDRLFFLVMRLFLQSEDSTTPLCLVFSAIAGIGFILFAIALFVVSLLNLLTTLGVLKRGRTKLHNWTMALLSASPMALLITYYTAYMFTEGKLSDISIWSLVAIASAIILSLTFRYIFSKGEKASIIVARGIAIGLSIMVVCLAFAPLFKTTLKTQFQGRDFESEIDIKHNATFFTVFEISDLEKEEIEKLKDTTKSEKQRYFERQFSFFNYMQKKEAEGPVGESTDSAILMELLCSKTEDPVRVIFSFAYIPFVIMVVGVLLVLWQNLRFFVSGAYTKKIVTIGKLITAIACGVGLVFTVVFVICASSFIDDYITVDYGIKISAGIIFMFLFALGSVFCPSRITPKQKKVKEVNEKPVVEIAEQF